MEHQTPPDPKVATLFRKLAVANSDASGGKGYFHFMGIERRFSRWIVERGSFDATLCSEVGVSLRSVQHLCDRVGRDFVIIIGEERRSCHLSVLAIDNNFFTGWLDYRKVGLQPSVRSMC